MLYYETWRTLCQKPTQAMPMSIFIIHPEDWPQAQQLLKVEKWFEVLHPFDNLRDFTFLYGMTPFRFFIRGIAKLDVCFQLACRSTNAG